MYNKIIIQKMNKEISIKNLFIIFISAFFIFIFQFFFLKIITKKFISSESPLISLFFLIFILNILTASVSILLIIIKFLTNKFKKENKEIKTKQKENKLFIFLSIFFFILIFIFFILSNNDFFIKDKNQFIRLLISSFLSLISYSFFIFYIFNSSIKKIKEKITINHIVGTIFIYGIISIFLSILFFFMILPFLQVADNLNFEDKAKIGELNIWRIVFLYGFFTILTSFITFYKKKLRGVSIFLITYWIIGLLISIFINNKSTLILTNLNNDQNLIKDRNNCNKYITLEKVKNCTLLILRDDGGHGTGFVVKPGYVITNKHVIEGANKISTWYYKEREIKFWNYSEDIDLAILKLPNDINIEPCNWFDSSQLKIAEELYAIGWPNNPNGDSTVTKGILSRINKYENNTEEIQTDAPINPGNSGGPLVNECGIVGINTARVEWSEEYSPRVIEGMGFALSSNFIYPKIDILISNGNENKKYIPIKKYK